MVYVFVYIFWRLVYSYIFTNVFLCGLDGGKSKGGKQKTGAGTAVKVSMWKEVTSLCALYSHC